LKYVKARIGDFSNTNKSR